MGPAIAPLHQDLPKKARKRDLTDEVLGMAETGGVDGENRDSTAECLLGGSCMCARSSWTLDNGLNSWPVMRGRGVGSHRWWADGAHVIQRGGRRVRFPTIKHRAKDVQGDRDLLCGRNHQMV
jgi:hypothetical protein